MLSHISLTDGSGSDKVEAGGGVVDPGVEVVARGNGDGETFWIVWSGIIAAIERFIFRSEGDVVVEELAELHHHVSVAGVRVVLVRVILLRHPPRIVEGADPLTTSRLLSTILISSGENSIEFLVNRSPFWVSDVVANS